MKKLLQQNIFLFKVEGSFLGLAQIWAPVFIIYQMLGIGLTLPQVLIGETVLAAVIFVLELPSGVFADVFGRKKTLIIQSLFMMASVFVFLISEGLLGVIIAQVLFGTAVALYSGTHESIFFDTLKSLKREKSHKKEKGQYRMFNQIFSIVGTISAGLFASVFISLPLIIAGVLHFAIFITRLFMTEPSYKKSDLHPFKHLLSSLNFSFKHKHIRNILLFYAILSTAATLLFNTINPFFEISNLPIWAFGIVFAFFSLVSAFVSKYSYRIEAFWGLKKSLFLLWIVAVIGFTLLWGLDWGVVAAILFPALLRANQSFGEIITEDALHQKTESHHRATVMSVKGSLTSILTLLALPVLAFTTKSYGLLNSYLIIAVCVFVFAGSFLFFIESE